MAVMVRCVTVRSRWDGLVKAVMDGLVWAGQRLAGQCWVRQYWYRVVSFVMVSSGRVCQGSIGWSWQGTFRFGLSGYGSQG